MNESSDVLIEPCVNESRCPDVSVIVPIYNCERYLDESLGSLFDQDIAAASLEIIAVDDGSTDASLAILESMAAKRGNMRVISMPNSGSAAVPRNAGLDIATGRYVFFLDADDRIEPDTLRKTVAIGDETGSGVVLCKVGAEGPGKRGVPLPTRAFVKDRFAEDFIESKAFTTLGPTKLFRRSVIECNNLRFPTGYLNGEDQPFVMAAYLNSPHISVVRNKVYYWIHARSDGSNATSQKQSPAKILLKNLNLIRTIVDGTEAGERRDILLHRPVMGRGGIKGAFGRQFSVSFTKAERTAAIEETRRVLAASWTLNLRSAGPVEAQILVDLVVRGDVEGVHDASSTLTSKKSLPLKFDRDSQQFLYLPVVGEPISDLSINVTTCLESMSYSSSGLELSGHIGVPGSNEAPDAIGLIWRHRRKGVEIAVPATLGDPYDGPTGTRVDVFATTDPEMLKDGGHWDSFFEAAWGSLTLRARLGKDKLESISTAPRLIGKPATAAVIFTDYGNLTIDAGPSQNYPKDSTLYLSLKISGHLRVARRDVVFVEGPMDGFASASVKFGGSEKCRKADLKILSPYSAAIVLPRSSGPADVFELEDDTGTMLRIRAYSRK